MFITTFNQTKEFRNPVEIKTEMCSNLLKLFNPLEEEELREIVSGTFKGLSELLRLHGKSVKKLHVMIIDNTFKDSFTAWRNKPYTLFHSQVEDPLTLTDRIFNLIAEICKLNTKEYFRADFEFAIVYLAEIMATLEQHTDIVFEEAMLCKSNTEKK